MNEEIATNVVERLLLALAAQLETSQRPALAAGAVEALSDLTRAEAHLIFGLAGHLVHYGPGAEPLEALIHRISAVQRDEASEDTSIRAGDEVRLVGELPDSLVEYDETWLRETSLFVRHVGSDATVDVQFALTEDYLILTVPTAIVKPAKR